MTDLTGANLPSSFLSLQALGALSLLEPLSYTATDAISSLFSVTVECAIPDTRLQTMVDMQESMLYQPITLITSPAQDNTTQYYNGLVTGIEISVDKTTCTLTIEPALSLLKQSCRNRIFLDQTPFEIVHQIFQETILTAYPNFTWDDKNSAIETIALNTKNDMTMQYQESDLAFISRLLHQIGVYFYISCVTTYQTSRISLPEINKVMLS